MSNHGRFITIDFETRSAETVKVGPWKYSEHPTTDALCLAYAFGLDEEVHLWNAATEGIEESPPPDDLFERIEQGWLVEAHNAMFERAVWTNVMSKRRGWPAVPVRSWRCTAARAAYHCLPRRLEELAGVALRLDQLKDPAGKMLIKRLSQPTKVLKAGRAAADEDMDVSEALGVPSRYFVASIGDKVKREALCYFNEDPDLVRQNWDYCRQDVRTERAASLEMPDLPERELAVWRMDQEMNARGVAVDLPMAHAAIEMARAETDDLNRRLAEIVPDVRAATQRAKVLAWLQTRVPAITDTQGETLDRWLKKTVPDDVREVIGIMRKVNRSSTAKYGAMVNQACGDGRMRDLLMFCGAHTLRWTARNVQPHNFPRGAIKHVETAADVIKSRDREWARILYGDVMELLSHALRGALVSGPGRRLWVADFSAIEARVVFWLSQCGAALEVFARGEDIYCTLASRIYGRTITKADVTERQLGKQSILGLGFGMGFCKFLITLRKYSIKFTPDQVRAIVPDYEGVAAWVKDGSINGGAQYVRRSEGLLLDRDLHELVLTKYIVDLYRSDFPEVPSFWKQQERSAIQAVRTGDEVAAGMVTWAVEGRRLVARLPSGTCQTYWDPEVKWENSPFPDRDGTRKKVPKLYYAGLDEKTRQWMTHHTYGGEVTENLVQHLARDIMADAMVRIERHPTYENVLSVHDEEVAESGVDEGDAEEFLALIKAVPDWARGCPIDAEAWTGLRYKKA